MIELQTLIQTLGPAGLAFFIMWLWLKSVEGDKNKAQIALDESIKARLVDKDAAQKALEDSQNLRLTELKEILPILTETSKGLQEVLSATTDNSNAIVEEILEHIDKKVNEIETRCKNNH